MQLLQLTVEYIWALYYQSQAAAQALQQCAAATAELKAALQQFTAAAVQELAATQEAVSSSLADVTDQARQQLRPLKQAVHAAAAVAQVQPKTLLTSGTLPSGDCKACM